MNTTRYYKVGDHLFSVSGETACFELMNNYEPFEIPSSEHEVCFTLAIKDGQTPTFTEELRQDEEGQVIVCGKTADGKAVFEYQWWGATAGWLVCTHDYRVVGADGQPHDLYNQWRCQSNFTVDSLADKLCEEYDVTAEQAHQDVADIVRKWQEVEVIE